MTDKVKCKVCNGSGYVGPKQADDTPSEMRIIGCAPCSFCNGGYAVPFVWDDHLKEESKARIHSAFEYDQFMKWLENEPHYRAKALCDEDYKAGLWKAWQAAKRAAK